MYHFEIIAGLANASSESRPLRRFVCYFVGLAGISGKLLLLAFPRRLQAVLGSKRQARPVRRPRNMFCEKSWREVGCRSLLVGQKIASLCSSLPPTNNMTSELPKNVFARPEFFKIETLTGSSQEIIGELGAHKAESHSSAMSTKTADPPMRSGRSALRIQGQKAEQRRGG
jgi:hypothetical protein